MKNKDRLGSVRLLLSAILVSVSGLSSSQPSASGGGGIQTSAIQTLAQYLGYDLNAPVPSTTGVCPANPNGSNACQNLLYYPQINNASPAAMQTVLTNMLGSFLGALIPSSTLYYLPGSPNADAQNTSGSSASSTLFPNSTFSSYASPSSGSSANQCPTTQAQGVFGRLDALLNKAQNQTASTQGTATITANTYIDQSPYQSDPVTQAVLNTLTTADSSYCMSGSPPTLINNCPYPNLYGSEVMINAIGTMPDPGTMGQNNAPPDAYSYLSTTYNQPLLAQLNSNSLIVPLMYSTDLIPSQCSNSPSSTATTNTPSALTATNQLEEAANFIRYATSAVSPIQMPAQGTYDSIYGLATDNSNPTVQQANQAILATFLTSLRVYTAQTSVGIANLYYILSKRIPQSLPAQTAPGGQPSTLPNTGTPPPTQSPTSQALSEFNMATWRLYNPNQTAGTPPTTTQWLTQINNATAATVQKEIAVLLAEINYQLYLNRQQDERILMTESVLLLQSSANQKPNTSLTTTS